MKIGDYLYLDTLDISKCFTDQSENSSDQEDPHVDSCVDKHYCGYGFNWPYFSFGSKFNFLFIMNAFNPTFI